MKNLKKYNVTEIELNSKVDTNGGCFAYDLGWFLRHGILGSFSRPGGAIEAGAEYGEHYATTGECA